MKYFKIIISVILTIAFLQIAKNNAMNRPSFYSIENNDYGIEYLSTPKVIEKAPYTIQVKIIGQLAEDVYPVVRKIKPEQNSYSDVQNYTSSKMKLEDSAEQIYSFSGVAGERGIKTYYYFEVHDSLGQSLVTLSHSELEWEPFALKYIGHVPLFVLISHIFLIFLSVFFIILATVQTFIFYKTSEGLPLVAKYTLWAVITCFLGGYPFGFAMNWYAFNGLWEGVPFGTDATDNKTQLLFAYLLFALIAMYGSLRNRPEKNLHTPKTTALIALGSFGVMTFVNLIPHSIQFSKSFTETFCYSFIGIVFLLTIYPIILKTKKNRSNVK